jgi:putative transposase
MPRQLGRSDLARRESYRDLFKAHMDKPVVDQIRRATNGNHALGNARFHD